MNAPFWLNRNGTWTGAFCALPKEHCVWISRPVQTTLHHLTLCVHHVTETNCPLLISPCNAR